MFHANAANTMLTGTYLDPVPDSQTLLWVALITAVIGIAVLMLPLWASILITLLVGLSYVIFAFARFNNGHVMNFVYPSIAVLFAFIGGLGLRYFGETRQRRRVTALFSQYVPGDGRAAAGRRGPRRERGRGRTSRHDRAVLRPPRVHRDVGEPRAGDRPDDAQPLLRPGHRRRAGHATAR